VDQNYPQLPAILTPQIISAQKCHLQPKKVLDLCKLLHFKSKIKPGKHKNLTFNSSPLQSYQES
jgi:hypothetical protein